MGGLPRCCAGRRVHPENARPLDDAEDAKDDQDKDQKEQKAEPQEDPEEEDQDSPSKEDLERLCNEQLKELISLFLLNSKLSEENEELHKRLAKLEK